MVTPRANSSTGAFRRMTASAGIISCGIRPTMNFKPPQDNRVPSTAPPSAKIRLSTKSWRIKRLRLPPSAGPQSGQCRTAQRQNQTLHQELANQTAAARAQRGTNGKFFLAGGGSGQKKICHVSAANQQQQANGSKHDIESGAEAPDHQICERLNLHRKVLGIILGVDGR